MHWPCRLCSCRRGAFEYPINACLRCGHEMDDHEEIGDLRWNPVCGFVCERESLVDSILDLAEEKRVGVIRATPLVGKSTLLLLLGRRAVETRPKLEPVYIDWADTQGRNGDSCKDYLQHMGSKWRHTNTEYRQPAAKTRTIYLIDEAQNSYGEAELWARILKSPNTRTQPMFVLVCVYGAAAVSHSREPVIESHALAIDSLQRVELRPSALSGLYMLFKPDETTATIKKWAIQSQYTFEDGVPEYLHTATDGHPGMVGMLLRYFDTCFTHISDSVRFSGFWSRSLCHELLVEHDGLVDWLSKYGRGLWTSKLHNHVKGQLKHPIYQHLSFSEVQKVLREVAIKPDGLTRVPAKTFDAFAFCHKQGMLHI